MAELKTQRTKASVDAFLQAVTDEAKRRDCITVAAMMKEITGAEPAMWGDAIVGFGAYHYTYASGRSGDWPLVGFSPRKQNLVLYLMPGFEEQRDLLKRLGKHKTGKACLYINRLSDVDVAVLRELIARSVDAMRRMYPAGH